MTWRAQRLVWQCASSSAAGYDEDIVGTHIDTYHHDRLYVWTIDDAAYEYDVMIIIVTSSRLLQQQLLLRSS